jgi:hypothetical protein
VTEAAPVYAIGELSEGFASVEMFASGVDTIGTELVFAVIEQVTDDGDDVVWVILVGDVVLSTGCGVVDEFDITVTLRVLLLELP